MAMSNHTQARVYSYGLDPSADLWADRIVSKGLEGVDFRLHTRDDQVTVNVPLLGRHSVHTALRAAAVGLIEGLSWDDIVLGMHSLSSQLRLVAVPGPHGSVILDDTYNSSPESALAALNLLADLPGRRVAVLGDMLELGPAERSGHRQVGRRSREVADILVTVGERARLIAAEASMAGLPAGQVRSVARAEEAIPILEELLQPGDVILVKGSRAVQLERVISALSQESWPSH
jgi:UDP-N-acetylmuramoyl-tripeptide--D-alanyl-D-alanine ligase